MEATTMIDLTKSTAASPLLHSVATDPGMAWVKDAAVAIDVPPDSEVDPAPEGTWPGHVTRTGVYGAVGPRVVAFPGGGYRLYYTQISPRPGFPTGALDYDNATARILSAKSSDGTSWVPEAGVRLSAQDGGAGEFRVVSSEVVPLGDASGRLRMYYECSTGPQSKPSTLRSALSEDGGLVWTPEPGVRLGASARSFTSPRIIFLQEQRWRLYCYERGKGIVSALSEDGGLTFVEEPGLRIAQDRPYDAYSAFASEVLCLEGGGYRMYYAGYSALTRTVILSAVSDDGLKWRKEAEPAIAPDGSVWDAAKCSEMCVLRLPGHDGQGPRSGRVDEACDGRGKDKRGVWRIARAVSGE